jgi:hypothetical protein
VGTVTGAGAGTVPASAVVQLVLLVTRLRLTTLLALPAAETMTGTRNWSVSPICVINRVSSRVITQPSLLTSWIPAVVESTSANSASASMIEAGSSSNPEGARLAGKVTVMVPGVVLAATVPPETEPLTKVPTTDQDRARKVRVTVCTGEAKLPVSQYT